MNFGQEIKLGETPTLRGQMIEEKPKTRRPSKTKIDEPTHSVTGREIKVEISETLKRRE